MCGLTITHSKRSAEARRDIMADAAVIEESMEPGHGDAGRAASKAVDWEVLKTLSSTVSGHHPEVGDLAALFQEARIPGVCLALGKMPSVSSNKAVVKPADFKKAFSVLQEAISDKDAVTESTWNTLHHKGCLAAFTELVKGMRTSFSTTSMKCLAASADTVSAPRTRPPASADKYHDKGPTFPDAKVESMVAPALAATLPMGYAAQMADWFSQTGQPMALRPPIAMFNMLMQTLMCVPPTISDLVEIAPDLYKEKTARWQLLRIFLDHIIPSIALCCVSVLGHGILLHFPAGKTSDEITMYDTDGHAHLVRVGLKVAAYYAFCTAVRTLCEGTATGAGLGPASTLLTLEAIWVQIRQYLEAKKGSLTSAFEDVQSTMVVVEAPTNPGKQAASDQPKGKGKMPVKSPPPTSRSSGAGSSSGSKAKKDKKDKKSRKKRARSPSSSSSSSSSESDSDSSSDEKRKPKGDEKKKSKKDKSDKSDKKGKADKADKSDKPDKSKKDKKSDKKDKKDDKKSGKKRARSPSPSDSDSSSSSSASWDDSMGGSRTSIMPCYREAYDRGGCDRGDDCPFSHRPSLIKAARAKKGGPKGRK